MADIYCCPTCGKADTCECLEKMLRLRKELDPGAPDAIVFPEGYRRDKRLLDIQQRAKDAYDPKMGYAFTKRPSWNDVNYLLSLTDTTVEAQRLADCVVDAAIKWHQSDIEGCIDEAQALEDAIEKLLEFRRKMPNERLRRESVKVVDWEREGERVGNIMSMRLNSAIAPAFCACGHNAHHGRCWEFSCNCTAYVPKPESTS